MNREQARIILWGLHTGAGDEKRREEAIGVVLDLLQETVVEPPSMPSAAVLDAMRKRLAELDAREKPTAPFPGSWTDEGGEIERLRKLAEDQECNLAGWSSLWARVTALVGVGSQRASEVTIDRIAYLAEVEKTRPTKQRFDELQTQRDDLLTAIRNASADNGRPVSLRLQDVVNVANRINNAREDNRVS